MSKSSSSLSSVGKKAMVSSAHPLATAAGLKVLKKGGNAVDAAVATSLALGVVAPAFSGLGGGGFILVHLKDGTKTLYIDYRETAPLAATPSIFELEEDGSGEAKDFANSMGYRAVGVPGTVAGLTYALEHYGRLKFREVAAYAIEYARRGFAISRFLGYIMANNVDNASLKFRRYPETGRVWLKSGRPYRAGEKKVNVEFADALELIGREGPSAFYGGKLGDALTREMAGNEGLIGAEDLARYSVKERRPATGTFREYDVIAMPPPSMGGVAIIQLLNIFETLDLGGMGLNSAETIAVMAKALALVWPGLRKAVGDPDFVDVDLARLTSKGHTERLWFGRGERGSSAGGGVKNWTTHMSVIDEERNVAAITESLECYFGSGVTVPGTGFCLNDTMHDFDVGAEEAGNNSIAPGKRPLSNMTPTLLLKDGMPFLVAGSAGGPRIVTATLQTILNVTEHALDVQKAIDAPRIHYQGSGPIRVESRIRPAVRKKLGEMGFETETPNYAQLTPGYDVYFGGVHAIMTGKKGELRGGADRRRQGAALGY